MHDDRSSAFDLLHETVKRWIWDQRWSKLREIQELSIPALLVGRQDLIISAGTASGKTEAAFLPIISDLAGMGQSPGDGFAAVYISPMKALINNQFERMESLCETADIPVHKWHGDVTAGRKASARKHPGGVVLITPESLEAVLITRGAEAARLFRSLRYVVIDEMHAFVDSARGKQLQSILHRIDMAICKEPRRIGLSATLADEEVSKQFLRPLDPQRVYVLPSAGASQAIQLQIRGYISEPKTGQRDDLADPSEVEIHRHLFSTLKGGRHLIFAGARGRVESVTAALEGMNEALGQRPEFFPHHGSLAKEIRESSEEKMKDSRYPATIVCTSTLEMGIDVGEIESVAQIGAGHSVSGMRQRLGRTGRRAGNPSRMRIYVREPSLDDAHHPIDRLRQELVKSMAMVNLMLQRWNEPPAAGRLNLSTALHQVIALIAQWGGAKPERCWEYLYGSGVFNCLSIELFKQLLLTMKDRGLIEMASDRTLLLGPAGERLLLSRDIYSVFMSPEEFRVITDGGKTIGQIPILYPLSAGQFILLGGRRWQVISVQPDAKEISVKPAHGGKPPQFGGEPAAPAEGVVMEMRRIYEATTEPQYLDPVATRLLLEGRESYADLGLRSSGNPPCI